MKTIRLSIAVTLLAFSINANAQLNYLFSASTKTYVPVDGGIAPRLIMSAPTFANPPWTLQDEGFAHVPVGFKFNYDGKEYDSVTICANGFVTLGDTITTRIRPLRLYNNFLASGPSGFYGVRPIFAPFWDDLDIVDTLNMVYKTSGHAPFRVFTVEWKKTKWTFESTEPALSIQLKLYEKTNVIEFHYNDEGGTPYTPRAFASIGITSSYNHRGFISLQNASSNPAISFLRANDSITVKPADNQLYTFTPSKVEVPELVINSKFYTDQSAGYKLKYKGPGNMEYAFSKLSVPPGSGIQTSNENIFVNNLEPATTYYIYGRAVKNKNFYSQWTCDSFTTAITPVALPYHISGNPNVYPYFPPDIRIQDMNDTALGHFPNSDADWNVLTDFPEPGDTSIWSLSTFFYEMADSWLFTPGLKLEKGKSYQLQFSYLSFPIIEPGEIASFEIKYGEATGAVAMTAGTLFKRDDIVTDFGGQTITFDDTTISITPSQSGTYYIGFHNLTKRFNGHEGPVPVIRNISISETMAAKQQVPYVLSGKSNNQDNILSWQMSHQKAAGKFEMQRSTDGINFKTIGEVASNAIGSLINSKTFRIKKNEEIDLKDIGSKNSLADVKPRFELQRSDDGINYSKLNAPNTTVSNKRESKVKYDFTHHNANGVNYYRIKNIDKKGNVRYSNVLLLNNQLPKMDVSVYPSPAKNQLNIKMNSKESEEIKLQVTDFSGRVVLNKITSVIKGESNIKLDISPLAPGTYFLKLMCTSGCENGVIKFAKQ